MNIGYLRKLVLEILTEDQKSLKFSKQRLEGLILEVLAENKRGRALASNLIKKYPEYSEQIQAIVDADPSKGPQKYLSWSVLQLVKGNNGPEKIIDAIEKFDSLQRQDRISGELKNLSKKNYPALSDLVAFVEEIQGQKTGRQKRKEERLKAIEEAEIFKLPKEFADRYIVVSPKTHKASCYWGRGTKWCTTMREDNEFINITVEDNSVLYYVIDKTKKSGEGGDPEAKIAFSIPVFEYEESDLSEMEIFDSLDDSKSLYQIPEDHEEIFEQTILPWHKDLEESVVVSYQKEKTIETFKKLGLKPDDLTSGDRSDDKKITKVLFNLKDTFTPEEIDGMMFTQVKANLVDLEGVDYSSLNLMGIDFTLSTLSRANLSSTILDRAILEETDLREANLTGASLVGVELARTNFEGADLTSASLDSIGATNTIFKDANLTSTSLRHAVFVKCNARNIDFSLAKFFWTTMEETFVDGANFRQADLHKVIVKDSSFKGADFSGAEIANSSWQRSNFSGANFSGVNFAGTQVSDSDFSEADLTGAKLAKKYWTSLDLTRANLTEAEGTKVKWKGVVGEEINLSRARLESALIQKSLLRRADFSDSDLTSSFFEKCALNGANFAGAKLKDVDFSTSTLTGANIEDADFDESTIWPADFSQEVFQEMVRTGRAKGYDEDEEDSYYDEEDSYYDEEDSYHDEEDEEEDSLFDDYYR